mgnify:CR=1 FL=1
MKKIKKLVAIMCAVMVAVSCAVPALACTPPLKTPHIDIPEIEVKIDDKLQSAIDEAAKKFLEKNVLEKPSVKYTSYIKRTSRYGTYGCLSVQWDKVDNATHYEVMVVKADGTKKTYTTSYNAFVRANYADEFHKDGLENVTVRVKAYGENETFSLWSDNVVVTTYNF